MSTKNNDLASVVDVLTQIRQELVILTLPEETRFHQRLYFRLAQQFQSLLDSISELEKLSEQRLEELNQNQASADELDSDELLNQANNKLEELDNRSSELFDTISNLIDAGGVVDTFKIVYE